MNKPLSMIQWEIENVDLIEFLQREIDENTAKKRLLKNMRIINCDEPNRISGEDEIQDRIDYEADRNYDRLVEQELE